jgi:hypothetical protein
LGQEGRGCLQGPGGLLFFLLFFSFRFASAFLAESFGDKSEKGRFSKGCNTGLKQDFKILIYCLKIIFKGLQIFLV